MTAAMDIGTNLVGLCKEGRNVDAIREHYADDVVSVEAAEGPGGPRTTEGKEAVLGKTTWWQENHEVHDASVEGPFPHGDDKFAVLFYYDVTNKPSGQRMAMREVAVYELRDGKIAREEFFYPFG